MKNISVCIGTACYLKGSYRVIDKFQDALVKHNIADKVNIEGAYCLNKCGEKGIRIRIDENEPLSITEDDVDNFVKNNLL